VRQPDDRHFSGEVLWGDDFDEGERHAWYIDEKNAYMELYASAPIYEYEYETVNVLLGFANLPPNRRFRKVLGLGSAYGDELTPISDRLTSAVIVESADGYEAKHELPMSIEWRKAAPSGNLPLSDHEVDLAVCLGVLHHLPNVSHVISELGRVVEPGGFALIREPIISMGDWREHRPGLTQRERGVPREMLLQFCRSSGFEVVRERLCFFPGSIVLARILRRDRLKDPVMVRLDSFLSSITRSNYRYHATTSWQKVRPTSVFLTLRKGHV
jgi:SAM-dependent methyltransferase